jgi:hypothetical protein
MAWVKGNAWALALALVMGGALVLAGCGDGGGGGDDEDTSEDSTPGDTVSDMTDAIPDPTTEPPEDTPTEGTPDYTPGDALVGDPCTVVDDCAGIPSSAVNCMTDIMGMIEFPGGYCSADCTTDDDCGEGATCYSAGGFLTLCLKDCTSDSDCRESEGYGCDEIPYLGGGPFCIPAISMPDMPPDGYTDVFPDMPTD